MHHRKQACAWVIDTIRACYHAGLRLYLPFGGTPLRLRLKLFSP